VRASRLISLLVLCGARSTWTASELADELDVSVRTIYRDVAGLQGAGVPLWTESGPGGGIRLLPGWRSRVEGLTGDEAAVLPLAGLPGLSELGLGAVALSARLKVRSTLPPELRSRAARLEERFHLDAPGWFHRPDPTDHLAALAEALWSERRVDLVYDRGSRTVRRRVDPLGLVLKAGTWYLVARHRGTVRTYRVGRVRACTPLEATFERPADFDLASWWEASSRAFDRSILRYRCELELSPGAQRRLPQVTDMAAAQDALERGRTGIREGWVVVELDCEAEEVIADQLRALGDGVEVRSPTSLRARVHRAAQAMADLNAPAG
jgi:predicted DNA-binding transcriptional regulator YafY